LRRLILRSHQSPGDILMLTAAVRELHTAHPGKFQTDVQTSAEAIWENNPYLTKLKPGVGVESIDMHYPLIHQSNERPFHFIHGYTQFLEKRLGISIPVTRFSGDIHLGPDEKTSPPLNGHSPSGQFWILMAGGKYDFTAKWWNPASYQKVVDHFRGRIQFVQCGEAGHWHSPLDGVVNLIGKTSLREFIRLMHYAAGVVCPVTFAMHLSVAVETVPGMPKVRPCVVIAGGREPPHWEAYPHHQHLSTVGMLSCCLEGGCWKSRCQTVGDGDEKDRRDLCEQPVQVSQDLKIPRCMEMITPEDVIRKIEMYLSGVHANPRRPVELSERNGHSAVDRSPRGDRPRGPKPSNRILLEFRHGLGDGVQLSIVLRHLKHYYPAWQIDLCAQHGKHSVGNGFCQRLLIDGKDVPRRSDYHQVFKLDWHECQEAHADWPSTKPIRCLREVFHLPPILELCQYQIARSPLAEERARVYLATICEPRPDGRFPVVLIHYQGNTSGDKKDLSHVVARRACDTARELGYVPVILDWDRRSPLVDQRTVFNPGADHPLWGGNGTGDAEQLAALIEASSLMIGIDSGPLHVAGATTTPTIGVWTRHHPVHFFDLAPNTKHLVPTNHRTLVKGDDALEFFERHYDYEVYTDLAAELAAHVRSQLTGEPVPPKEISMATMTAEPVVTPSEPASQQGPQKILTSVTYEKQYYEEHQRAGLDYLNFGEWQQRYGRWFVESFGFQGKRVLDVGCACGSILRGLGEAKAIVEGIDLSEHMIHLGRQKWPDMAPLLHVADAANLHRFGPSSWQGIHSAQVAEHWNPDQVPKILLELNRITVPGGLFFCSLDTEELFARQHRDMETEDPTHICVKPRAWWIEQLAQAGWTDVTAEYEPALLNHPDSFLKLYDWDFFVARKSAQGLPVGSYDLDAYPKSIWEWSPASLDPRHLYWMFDVLAAGQFQHALEIGCLNGASSTAFVEAINRQFLQRATFCDIDLRETFHSVIERAQDRSRAQTFQGRSVDFLKSTTDAFDFVFIDGDHRLDNTRQEVELLLQRNTLCVMAHDTNVQSFGYGDCDGTPYIKWRFQTAPGYYCLEDNAVRPGEDTGRGLFFATTSLNLFEAARTSLRKWGRISVPDSVGPPTQ
jgi:ADP-heptose:LPS heptosyltransferase/SAM-dependent methyltransferase